MLAQTPLIRVNDLHIHFCARRCLCIPFISSQTHDESFHRGESSYAAAVASADAVLYYLKHVL